MTNMLVISNITFNLKLIFFRVPTPRLCVRFIIEYIDISFFNIWYIQNFLNASTSSKILIKNKLVTINTYVINFMHGK